MPYHDREELLLRYLTENRNAAVGEIAKALFVSEPTVRRDLNRLACRGLVIRTHGGAVLRQNPADERIPYLLREQSHSDRKADIARKAAALIRDGDTLMLDATTSAYHLLPFLSGFRDLVVITSGAAASLTLGKAGIRNICTGGRMITESLSYVGKTAEETVRRFNADLCFFSCRGLSPDGFLTDSSVEENDLRRAMLAQSRHKVFLCDSSKLGVTCLHNLCRVSELDAIVCDTALPENIASLLPGAKARPRND